MNKFNAGDRVRTKPEATPNLIRGPFSGTVISQNGDAVVLTRDDGITGGTTGNTAWSTNCTYLELILGERAAPPAGKEVTTQPKKHVMGLDPEGIDWDAHKAFGRM